MRISIEKNRVPNLKFDWFVVDSDHSSPKFNTYGEVMDGLESLVCELKKKTGFPNS